MTATVLARACHAEWSRMRSLRSSWILAAATTIAVVGLGLLIGVDTANQAVQPPPTATAWDGARFTAMFALFGVLALAVLTSTADYTTGGIVPTLQWTPRRGVLLTARSAVTAVVTTVMGVLLVGIASVVVRSLVPAVGLPLRHGLEILGGLAFLFATGALLAVGIGLALRSTPGALVSVIALILVLPLVLGNLPQQWAQDVAARLPGSCVIFLISEEGLSDDMTLTSARVTMAVWSVAAIVVGGCGCSGPTRADDVIADMPPECGCGSAPLHPSRRRRLPVESLGSRDGLIGEVETTPGPSGQGRSRRGRYQRSQRP